VAFSRTAGGAPAPGATDQATSQSSNNTGGATS
jgi:hypothetical protein